MELFKGRRAGADGEWLDSWNTTVGDTERRRRDYAGDAGEAAGDGIGIPDG